MFTVAVLFQVKKYKGTIQVNDDESKEVKFFGLDHLPTLEKRAKPICDKIKNGQIKIDL